MKIAVAYENGKVFQHFGKTSEFKIYEIEDGNVIDVKNEPTGDYGHEALAGFLAEKNVDVVICGNVGDGAMAALDAMGITVVSGQEGNVDQAVANYLVGSLTSKGVNCEKEEGEGCGCGGDCDCGGECGDDCGGCCGSCGGGEMQIIYEGKNAGKNVAVHYTGTLNDGTQFDSSYNRNEPIEFVAGVGMMIPGFDKAVVEMEVGEKKSIHLTPAEAYGERQEDAVFSIELEKLGGGTDELAVGETIMLTNVYGHQFMAEVTEMKDGMVTFDANHHLAGKELNFDIELVSVEEKAE